MRSCFSKSNDNKQIEFVMYFKQILKNHSSSSSSKAIAFLHSKEHLLCNVLIISMILELKKDIQV